MPPRPTPAPTPPHQNPQPPTAPQPIPARTAFCRSQERHVRPLPPSAPAAGPAPALTAANAPYVAALDKRVARLEMLLQQNSALVASMHSTLEALAAQTRDALRAIRPSGGGGGGASATPDRDAGAGAQRVAGTLPEARIQLEFVAPSQPSR